MDYSTDSRWQVFLAEVAKLPDRSTALERANISPEEYADRVRNDTAFVSKLADYFDAGIDALEDTAIRRAVLGVEEPVFWQGQVVGWKTVYSDRLLTFLLAGNRAKYRGEGDKFSGLTPEARKQLDDVFADATSDGETETLPDEFPSLKAAVDATQPKKRSPKKAKAVLFEPLPEIPTPARAASTASLDLEEEELAGEQDFGIPELPGDDDAEIVASARKQSAKMPTALRKPTTPPPPKPTRRKK